MKKILTLAFLPLAFYSCTNQSEKQAGSDTASSTVDSVVAIKDPVLTKVWETDTVLTTAESTLYKESDNVIYVSNIGGRTENDGDGFISTMDPDGSILTLKWVTGLNDPKGMTIMDDKLYVTDVNELVEINIADSSIANRYPTKGAVFLNDAASDGDNVYFSDSRTGKIHVLEDGTVSTVAQGMENVNGLAFNDAGELFILNGQGLISYNPGDSSTVEINEVVTGGDGLVILNDSTYIASRWQGEIYLIRNGKEHLLLDTKSEESNTADIDYIADENLLLVPTFMKSKVVAYELEY